ncbi:hypothetical protein ACLB2K_077150 [Fragaria x ananassa]
MSISLRDLTYICGLPITGRFYDKVVPSIEESSAKGKGGELIIPKSCRFLFLAYHKLYDKGQRVKIASWIQYWIKGSLRYKRPPAKSVRNKKDAPQNTYNPFGEIHEVQARTDDDSAPFDDLGVDDEDIESTYLAAFYACWLCLFVFLMDDIGLIRPSVFKVASKMSQGHQFCLAILVLANIYQGLNKISVKTRPEFHPETRGGGKPEEDGGGGGGFGRHEKGMKFGADCIFGDFHSSLDSNQWRSQKC